MVAIPEALKALRRLRRGSTLRFWQKVTLRLGRRTQSWVNRVNKPRHPPEGNPIGGREERTR
jgi:hypothetical protein